jgi:hypothetical protein
MGAPTRGRTGGPHKGENGGPHKGAYSRLHAPLKVPATCDAETDPTSIRAHKTACTRHSTIYKADSGAEACGQQGKTPLLR